MHEMIMKRNFKKTFKILIVMAVLLAVLSAAVVPMSLSQQIRDWKQLEQSAEMGNSQSAQAGHHGERHADEEHLWKTQITPLSAANYAVLGGTLILWIALAVSFWLSVAAWLNKSAVLEGMNKSLWAILGLFLNLVAVLAFLIVRDNPGRIRAQN